VLDGRIPIRIGTRSRSESGSSTEVGFARTHWVTPRAAISPTILTLWS